jgi:hypothetical protein
MLKKVFQKLDQWIKEEDKTRREEGRMGLQKANIRIVGQMALLEAKVDLELVATMDVDAFLEAEHAITKKFEKLLADEGLILDSDSKLIWMPEETVYENFWSGKMLKVELAQTEYIMISKALKAPAKNAVLITQYLEKAANQKFMNLAEKYELDLEQFL